jgi:hypothetical protein
MVLEYAYCDRWFRARKRLISPLKPERARQLHQGRHLYTVLCGDPERPMCFIEFNDSYCGIGYLDDRLREELSYQFQEIEPGSLFLTMAVWREFRGDTDRVARGTSYHFKADGSVTITREEFDPRRFEEAHGRTETRDLWEKYPHFGDYRDLIRRERVAVV